jgi:hypothetical protein
MTSENIFTLIHQEKLFTKKKATIPQLGNTLSVDKDRTLQELHYVSLKSEAPGQFGLQAVQQIGEI